ncbi:MAG: hypothetical protein ACFBWO_09540 [Paracoccaceae bacterium]
MADRNTACYAARHVPEAHVPRGPLGENAALDRAAGLMMAELERLAEEHRRLKAEIDALGLCWRSVHAAAEQAMETLPAEARRPFAARIARALRGRFRDNGGKRRPDTRAEAVRWFLMYAEQRVFRAAEVTQWLNAHDWPTTPKETASTLKELVGQGYAVRVKHGSYRPVYAHPVLLELQTRMLDG